MRNAVLSLSANKGTWNQGLSGCTVPHLGQDGDMVSINTIRTPFYVAYFQAFIWLLLLPNFLLVLRNYFGSNACLFSIFMGEWGPGSSSSVILLTSHIICSLFVSVCLLLKHVYN